MFDPSLILLILKTVAVFVLCTLTGWSVVYRSISNIAWANWVVFAVVGAALLNLVCIWGMLLGFPGWTGLLVVAFLLGIKIFVVLRRDPTALHFTKQKAKEIFTPIILFCSLSSVNYLAPFVIEGTSGYYARGGGDHSTYLVLSEWFTENTIWDKQASYEVIPPQRHWEPRQFVNVKSKFYPANTQPLANQFVATPFMSIFPGSNEETYTAAVAFYLSMACWSVLALLIHLLQIKIVKWWVFVPLFLSNLIIYGATCHSIPYVFAISMINVGLLLYWLYSKEPLWTANVQQFGHFFPLGLLHASLLAIYPHGFVILMVFAGVMMLGCGSWEGFKRYFTLGLISTLFGMAVANFLLLISIPLLFTGLGFADSYGAKGYHILHIISSYTGVPDFLLWAPNIQILQKKVIFGLIALVLLLIYAGKSFKSAPSSAKPIIASFFVIPVSAIAYYHFRGNGSYQIVRFAELGHLYLLAMAGFAFYSVTERFGKQLFTTLAVVFILIVPEMGMRAHAVKEVVSVDHFFATEFRDAEALMGVKKIETLQNHTRGVASNRIAYYFGPGDGVDFAGGSVLLRNLHYMPARGNTLASWFDLRLPGTNTRAWKKEWLDDALLVIRPESDTDIIEDLRPTAFSNPLLDTKRLKIYDSTVQPLTQLVGDSWHTLKFYPSRKSAEGRPYRYLKGIKASIVVWSQEQKKVSLSLYLSSDAPDSQIEIESKLFSENIKTFNIPKWESVIPNSPAVQMELDLKPGANVLLITPKRKDAPPPWFLFWKVQTKNVDL
jgi:hypothetical protein